MPKKYKKYYCEEQSTLYWSVYRELNPTVIKEGKSQTKRGKRATKGNLAK